MRSYQTPIAEVNITLPQPSPPLPVYRRVSWGEAQQNIAHWREQLAKEGKLTPQNLVQLPN